ncbi:unnamed protein product [Malus baccata var. baccata]
MLFSYFLILLQQKVPYANVVGCLMYEIVCTRPDLAQAINIFPSTWQIKENNIRMQSSGKGLCLESIRKNARVLGYVDANHVGGYVFTCARGPLSWRALLLPITTLLTIEAEYPELGGRSKHIEKILVKKFHTDDNVAGFLTKIVPANKFKHCLNLINLIKTKYFRVM